MNLNANFVEQAKIVTGFAPGTPSTTTPDYVSLKNYERMTAIIIVDNGNTVTGSAITVKQDVSVAGSTEKPVAFTKAWRNIDTGAADALAEFAVSSNTFTTDATNAKNLLYAIEITPDMLDVEGGFDCVRIGTGDGANMVLAVIYLLHGPKYSTLPTAITD